MKSFVTIKEFAALANITTQAVYKRINQDVTFQQYIKFDGKYKLINTDALKIFAEEHNDNDSSDINQKPEEKPAVVPEPNPKPEPEPAPNPPETEQPKNSDMQIQLLNNTTDKLVSSLENHIDDLKKEIQTLRNELAEKNMQLSNLNERLANEQELHRHNQLLLVSNQDEKQEKEPEKQSGFLKKIFGK